MVSGITCQVYADGVRMPDGSTGDPLTDPTILTDLKIDWGRETTVDQPAATSCSFTVLDYEGGRVFTDMLKIGTQITVVSEYATTDPDVVAQNVWPDGGFETNLWDDPMAHALITSNRTPGLSITTDRPHSGIRCLQYTHERTNEGFLLGPLEFLDLGDRTGAWDAIPQSIDRFQRWDISFWLWGEPGVEVGAQSGVFDLYGNVLSISPVDAFACDGTWQQIKRDPYAVGGDYRGWLGVGLRTATGDVKLDDISIRSKTRTDFHTNVFIGRVVSMVQSWDDTYGAPTIKIECLDLTADLENTVVGDIPWPVQTVPDRFETITNLTALPAENSYAIADTFDDILLSWRDVDAQGAMGLLSEIASSVDGVLWLAVSTDYAQEFLYLEDPATRTPLSRLTMRNGYVSIVPINDASTGALELTACDILRDGVTWTQDVQDVTTRVAVIWREQTTDEDGRPAPTERTYTFIDTEMEARFGQRGLSLSSQLQAQNDAVQVAGRIHARTANSSWRADGLVIDDTINQATDLEYVQSLMALLNANNRNGLALVLVDMPGWAIGGDAAGVYLEGGTYTYSNDGNGNGAWILNLTVSNSVGLGDSVTWDQLQPTGWTWNQFGDLTWDDLRGVAGPSVDVRDQTLEDISYAIPGTLADLHDFYGPDSTLATIATTPVVYTSTQTQEA